ncbi:MAG: hypothetical protein H7138_27400, partial [Myxococcales bacterium]|nr:hypothetical protein [Myxococcales bacterium]
MRPLLLALLLTACAGPSRNPLADTPTATTRRPPSLAPPASVEDKERYQLDQQFEDMRDTQQAHRELEHAPSPAAKAPGAPASSVKPAATREP